MSALNTRTYKERIKPETFLKIAGASLFIALAFELLIFALLHYSYYHG